MLPMKWLFFVLIFDACWCDAGVADFTGVWMAPSGDFGVIVGTAGTIQHFDGVDWVPAASPTTEDLYDVHGLAPDDVVASGSGVILHWDGVVWSTVVSSPGTPYTPVLLTDTRIWYGIPDSQFPFVGRCDRLGQGCLGLVAETGSVLELKETTAGHVTLIGELGDIYEVDDALNQSPIYDHPLGDTMDFTAATVISDAIEGAQSTAYGANFAGIHRWQGSNWQWVADPAGSVFALVESPIPGSAVEGVGRSDLGDGFHLSLSAANQLGVQPLAGASGLGIADLAFYSRGFEPSKRGTSCVVATLWVRINIGDESFVIEDSLCRYAYDTWRQNDCGFGIAAIDVSIFLELFQECQGFL